MTRTPCAEPRQLGPRRAARRPRSRSPEGAPGRRYTSITRSYAQGPELLRPEQELALAVIERTALDLASRGPRRHDACADVLSGRLDVWVWAVCTDDSAAAEHVCERLRDLAGERVCTEHTV